MTVWKVTMSKIYATMILPAPSHSLVNLFEKTTVKYIDSIVFVLQLFENICFAMLLLLGLDSRKYVFRASDPINP